MPFTKNASAIWANSSNVTKADVRTWGSEVEAYLDGTPELANLDLTANNPQITFTDNDSANAGEIVLDNTGLRFQLDSAVLVPGSLMKFRIDGTDRATLNASGNLTITGAIEATAIGSALRAVINTGTKIYRSPATQMPVNGGNVSFTHGLGAVPDLVMVDAVCHTTHGAFSAGDRYVMAGSWSYYSGLGIKVTGTTVTVSISGSGASIVDASGTNQTLTGANFNIVLRAVHHTGL